MAAAIQELELLTLGVENPTEAKQLDEVKKASGQLSSKLEIEERNHNSDLVKLEKTFEKEIQPFATAVKSARNRIEERQIRTTSKRINKSIYSRMCHRQGNEIWRAICCCSVDRGTGEIRYGQWRMYHANFLGILDPDTNQQVCGPDIWTIIKRTGEIYGVQVELEGAPDWIMPAKPAIVSFTHPSPMKQFDADNVRRAVRCSLENQPDKMLPGGPIIKCKMFDYAQYSPPHLGPQL